jgi:conjugal transfer/entry exclusion protein
MYDGGLQGLHGLHSWARRSNEQVTRAVNQHAHCPFSIQEVSSQLKHRCSSTTSVSSGIRLSPEFLGQLEKSVSKLDNMMGQLNDTSSLKAEQIRDLQRQVNKLEPVATLLSQHRHIESEVLPPSAAL